MTHSYVWRYLAQVSLYPLPPPTNNPRLIFACVPTPIDVFDSFICLACLILLCNMTHSYAWHDSFIHMCDRHRIGEYWCESCARHDSFICLGHMWDNSFVCVMWLLCTCNLTDVYVWNDKFIYVTHVDLANVDVGHVWDMALSYTLIDPLTLCETWLVHIC